MSFKGVSNFLKTSVTTFGELNSGVSTKAIVKFIDTNVQFSGSTSISSTTTSPLVFNGSLRQVTGGLTSYFGQNTEAAGNVYNSAGSTINCQNSYFLGGIIQQNTSVANTFASFLKVGSPSASSFSTGDIVGVRIIAGSTSLTSDVRI